MENSDIQLKAIRATKINKTSRNIITLISIIKRLLNIPDRRVMIKISEHQTDFDQKPLTKSIVTEITTRKGIQTVNVKTDVEFRFLCKIP